ncbi:sn-glycerol-3-phosphate ABC transporter ATP-binding protein UgpC (plasmid) [Haloferax mediterranei ATCC 33500]|uniref:ABC-type D-xylose/L-arabinose transporter n=1 Tax=Haloferax mediterranei (strain ATCC 33500 / DSM 1411 / JCM 8866 / NBRC 14739 / NCIMB 2177 / R-4) TaxID=523841 RepID=I3R9F2_HALMT|nr:sn-glycerol-3-phosphate ABC transporter ATP-binding protein UgpC [Haloferax mediterranei]AFK20862.1 sugar ABC transporter ATP-binding protein (UGPC) [Haloferax mediterranei ATCC 33500]AHZ24269.1 sugar ABC transporter ATP-binding protein [Haloferax mediterranei ATCC 33500]EMA05348.1 sugar ABC transporter ATP-binding protein [Haloferax mediterranei ATCC 33500]MDX5989849.1 sn-glycerol-3-phosphate ABC transporter ATP-binding protein UgpC [Haloferax mediterranei ATCC 33500]QCQ77290.1 sn-glycerol
MSQLELRNLRKEFTGGGESVVAVDDVDLTLNDGEFLVLVGPSGCGKSTTLRMIAGLESVTSGDVIVDGESMTDLEPRERDIAMVFQNYALYPHMTTRENIGFGLKMTTDLDSEERNRQVEDVAESLGIEELLDDYPKELSGGQQQRVALGRAIIRDPEVFLMDEPLSNLDAKLRTQMRTELKALQDDLNVTTVYVTHDQTEAMTMGDRIAILNHGELQQVGTPLECYHQPANKFVAGFIGAPSMNFMDVASKNERLIHKMFDYEISEATAQAIEGYDRVTLGIRPEDIRIVDGSDVQNPIPAEVHLVEPLGDVSHVALNIGNKRFTAAVPGGQKFDRGEEVTLHFPEDSLHLFDATSGQTLKNSSRSADEEPVIHA